MARDYPRAYLRVSPDIDQHPDPEAMIRAMCAAHRQAVRGRFRDPKVLERAVGRRQYRAMIARGDVVAADDGVGVYLDGWDEWQEGDFTVAERMRRMRTRRNRNVTGDTLPASPDRNGVTTRRLSSTSSGTSLGVGVLPPTPTPQRNPRADGTNPRAVGEADRKARRWRRGERQLAYLRGAITAEVQADMDGRDAPLEEIPDYAEHSAKVELGL